MKRSALVTCFGTDFDECDLDLCAAGANCSNVMGGFLCSCNEGFSGDGLTCSGMILLNVTV